MQSLSEASGEIAEEVTGLLEHLSSRSNNYATPERRGRRGALWPCALVLGCVLSLSSCRQVISLPGDYSRLNSRFSDTQPAISGNGRFVAMVTNRGGRQDLALYDIQQKRFVDIPRLHRRNAIVESPSLSRSGRYIAYIVSERGRPEIALYDRITQRRQMLTSGFRGPVRNPSISPDGRYVAFESGRRGQWDIEVFDRGASVQLDLSRGVPEKTNREVLQERQSNGQ